MTWTTPSASGPLDYPNRRYGNDHDRYAWSMLTDRAPITWPDGKKLALFVVVPLQFFPLNPTGKPVKVAGNMTMPYPDLRHFTLRDYGNRVGIHRVLKALDAASVTPTFAVNTRLFERAPLLRDQILARGDEIMCHSWSMDTAHAGGLDEAEEKRARRAFARPAARAHRPAGPRLALPRQAREPEHARPRRAPRASTTSATGSTTSCRTSSHHRVAASVWSMPLSTEISDTFTLVDNLHAESSWADQVCDAADLLHAEARRAGRAHPDADADAVARRSAAPDQARAAGARARHLARRRVVARRAARSSTPREAADHRLSTARARTTVTRTSAPTGTPSLVVSATSVHRCGTAFRRCGTSRLQRHSRSSQPSYRTAARMIAQPLDGVRVVDMATLFAGPLAATILGDYGADVIKVEHPTKGDPARNHGPSKDGVPLWWTSLGRNKRTITLNVGQPEGADVLKKLLADADVLIENFRVGTLERWGLAPETLHEINPRLVILRVTGFGQFGPYAKRPGFGTIAESMSGFASITGYPDGPPTLPPFGLADGISALTGAQAIMTALYDRDKPNGSGKGQVIDLAIIEPIVTLLGMQPMVYDQLGTIQQRTGNRSVNNAPRNTYQTRDGKWVAISTSAQSIAERVMELVGHPEVIAEPWFQSGAERAKHADLLDDVRRRLDRRARLRRGHRRVREGQRRHRADLRHRRRLQGPAVPGARHHHHRRGPRARPGAHAERALPPVRDARRDQVDRPQEGRRQRRRLRRARPHRRADRRPRRARHRLTPHPRTAAPT